MAQRTQDPAVQEKIDAILKRVRDPESDLPIADLNLVQRVRVSDDHSLIYLDVPFDRHTPGCMTCAGIAMTIVAGIKRRLVEAFEQEFPGYTVEFI
ncbi:MAG: iron-sulfur cluster assembly protein [Spirochaeta sp.]|jgi:metal-sulfur cluster biosynthetic enzyme|nr:iron-sulfur cluster assembly protein [Spirochaeta sp.]